MIIVTVVQREEKGLVFTEEKDFFLSRGFFGLERGGERILGIEMPSRDDGRAGADYRESSKIVIHRSRSRVEREPTIISLITGFLEGERASSGGSTNPDETGPRANAEWNAFDSCIPKRSEASSLRFVEMEFGDSLEIDDAPCNVFKFSFSFLSKNFFFFERV